MYCTQETIFKLSFCLVSSNLIGSFTPRLIKGRERERKRNDNIFPFTCLVCKGEMEGNITY